MILARSLRRLQPDGSGAGIESTLTAVAGVYQQALPLWLLVQAGRWIRAGVPVGYDCLITMTDSPNIDPVWQAEFEAAARRPLAVRWRYAFIRTYKPVLDDARYRSFDTMEDYRRWCEDRLPAWLGYDRVQLPPG